MKKIKIIALIFLTIIIPLSIAIAEEYDTSPAGQPSIDPYTGDVLTPDSPSPSAGLGETYDANYGYDFGAGAYNAGSNPSVTPQTTNANAWDNFLSAMKDGVTSLAGLWGGLSTVPSVVTNWGSRDAIWEAGWQTGEDSLQSNVFSMVGAASAAGQSAAEASRSTYAESISSGKSDAEATDAARAAAWGVANDIKSYDQSGNPSPSVMSLQFSLDNGQKAPSLSGISTDFLAKGVEVKTTDKGYEIVREGYVWTDDYGWQPNYSIAAIDKAGNITWNIGHTVYITTLPEAPANGSSLPAPTGDFTYTGTDGKDHVASGSWSGATDGKQTFTGTTIIDGVTTAISITRDTQTGNLSSANDNNQNAGTVGNTSYTTDIPKGYGTDVEKYLTDNKPTSTNPNIKTVWDPNAQTEIINKDITAAHGLAGAAMTINGGWTQVVELDNTITIKSYDSNGVATTTTTNIVPLDLYNSRPNLNSDILNPVIVLGATTSAKSSGSAVENVHITKTVNKDGTSYQKIESGAWRLEVAVTTNAATKTTETFLTERQFGSISVSGDVSGIPSRAVEPAKGETVLQTQQKAQANLAIIEGINTASIKAGYFAATGQQAPDYSSVVGNLTGTNPLCKELNEDRNKLTIYLYQSDLRLAGAMSGAAANGKINWSSYPNVTTILGMGSGTPTGDNLAVLNYMFSEKVGFNQAVKDLQSNKSISTDYLTKTK